VINQRADRRAIHSHRRKLVPAAPFTDAEIEYLASQPLGRLATMTPDGLLQVKPVMFSYNAAEAAIDVAGHNMAASSKYHNVKANGTVAFVVDDMSGSPTRLRGIEIRGTAEALAGQGPRRGRSSGSGRVAWSAGESTPRSPAYSAGRDAIAGPSDVPARERLPAATSESCRSPAAP
jgi:pyridoxamine 5'-phosphate oxidase family protein